MKISYGITVCNELVEIQRLVSFLLENKRPIDEIVILFDTKNGSLEVLSYLNKVQGPSVNVIKNEFNGDFAGWKNFLTEQCLGEYVFQIDADELPHKNLILNLPSILSLNPKNEVYMVPRINTVEGITQEHINKWGWVQNSLGWINFPDYQSRIWKKSDKIRWVGKVHERLSNYNTYSGLPDQEIYCLYHDKQIERQEKQNNLYSNIMNNNE